jgi:translation initiation factor IF-2
VGRHGWPARAVCPADVQPSNRCAPLAARPCTQPTKLEPSAEAHGAAGPRAAAVSQQQQQGASLKSQVAGVLSKLKDSGVARRAADLVSPILSGGNSPRSPRPDSSADGAARSPRFGSASTVLQAGAPGGKGSTLAAAAAVPKSCTSSSGSSSQPAKGSMGPSPASAVLASTAPAKQQQPQQQPQPQQQQMEAAAATPNEAAGGFSSLSAAKKTLSKIFGSGAAAATAADVQGPGNSPMAATGLIAAFRAIIPQNSGASTGEWLRRAGCAAAFAGEGRPRRRWQEGKRFALLTCVAHAVALLAPATSLRRLGQPQPPARGGARAGAGAGPGGRPGGGAGGAGPQEHDPRAVPAAAAVDAARRVVPGRLHSDGQALHRLRLGR